MCPFLRNLGKARASPIRLRKSGSMLYSNVRALASRRLLFLAILIIVVAIITGVGWALYNQMQSASNAASQPNILLSNHATLTSPTYSSTWQIHLNSGKNIQVAIRTDYQVYLRVEYDCSGYNTNIATARCTLVPPVGFNPSGNYDIVVSAESPRSKRSKPRTGQCSDCCKTIVLIRAHS